MKRIFRKSSRCLICGSQKLKKYLSLGSSAFANSYLRKKDLETEEAKAPLTVYFCENCKLAQLLDIVDRNALFHKYSYFSSTSPALVQHFGDYANELVKLFPSQAKRLIVDIGSNDGILLKPLQDKGLRVLGVDPAENMAGVVRKLHIETIWEFFGTELVPKIIEKYGKAGIISANNVLAHTDSIHDILDGVRMLLEEDGVFVLEVQYILDMLEKNEFDNTYHEHICYFSLTSLLYLLSLHGLSAFKVKHVNTHGGSLRVYAVLKSKKIIQSSSIQTFLRAEKVHGLDKFSTFASFAKKPSKIKEKLCKLLLGLKTKNKKIIGYGAPAKASTLLQYCKIGPEVINYITDSAPSKQGFYLPGMHIPIVSPELLKKDTPDYIVILAWNYSEPIMKREAWFTKKGGKFIVPFPIPHIVKT